MRVKVEGLVNFDQLTQIIQDLYRRSPPGATIVGLNLYLTIRDDNGRLVEFLNPQGQSIDVMIYQEDRVGVLAQKPPVDEQHDPRVIPFKRRRSARPDGCPPSPAAA